MRSEGRCRRRAFAVSGVLPLLGLLNASVAYTLFVAAAYGDAAGLAYLLAVGERVPMGKRRHWIKFLIAFVLLYVCVQATRLLGGAFFDSIGLIPPPRPIREAPLW